MANCPKCNYKLKLTDWKPECPHCGTNVNYYNFEKQFYIDAKYAEMDAAKIRVKWARVKASFVGGKLPIARLVLAILPLIATLISFGTLTITLPLFEKKISFGTIGLFSVFTDGTLNYFSSLKNSAIAGSYADSTVKIIYGVVTVAALAFLIFLFQLLCFVSIKKMTIVLTATGACGIIAAVYSMLAVNAFSKITVSEIFAVKNNFGGIIVIFAFTVIFAINLSIANKGIQVKYNEGDQYRVEMAKKLKRKEITLDEISQPVFSPALQNNNSEIRPSGIEGGAANG